MLTTDDEDCGGVIAGFTVATVIALVIVVISVVINVILFIQSKKKTRY